MLTYITNRMNTQPQRTVSATNLQRQVGRVLRAVAIEKKHVLVERDGYAVAVLVPVEDYQRLTSVRSPAR